MKKLIIIGAGGFAAEVAWVAEDYNAVRGKEWDIIGCVDDDKAKQGSQVYGYPVLGTMEEWAPQLGTGVYFHCAIGSNRARKNVAQKAIALGLIPATLIHPSVIVAKNATIGQGTYIGAASVVTPYAQIGDFVLVNNRVAVGHHAVIGDYAQLCPGAQINGNCKVGFGALVGSNASLHPGVVVEDFATVGSNSQVLRNVPRGVTVNGVPASFVAKNENAEVK